MKTTLFICLVFLIFTFPLFSQHEDEGIQLTEELIEGDIFLESIDFYERFLYDNPNDPDINYKMGFALLNTKNREKESIQYFKKAKEGFYNKKSAKYRYAETCFQLARAYRLSYLFDEALMELGELQIKYEKSELIKMVVEREILRCESGKKLFENRISYSIVNLGDTVNSEFKDHSPVISADESILIFTSRRPNGWEDEIDEDGNFNEDIFISEKVDGKWVKPVSIGPNINTAKHEASIGLSVDGQKLLIYKDEDYGSIFMSTFQNGEWGVPEKLGPNINTEDRETHASLSSDGKYLYFTSDRPGGFGGLDIYVSELLRNGNWGPARNLGDAINTKYNEEGPYIHPDGNTLYFSSKGHENMGGYDIFKSTRTEFDTWTVAENLGYPINTVGDDIYYMPTADGQRAYYVSEKEQNESDMDIFLITLNTLKRADVTVMIGDVYTKCSDTLPDATITVKDKETDEEFLIKPNPKNKRFVFITKWGKTYQIFATVNSEIIFTDTLTIPKDNVPEKMTYKSIRLDPNSNCD
jgi:tetratricopeptide (TPR) repeat protein